MRAATEVLPSSVASSSSIQGEDVPCIWSELAFGRQQQLQLLIEARKRGRSCFASPQGVSRPGGSRSAQGPTWQQAVQWMEEVVVAPGMRLPLTASHDSYGISFSRGPPPTPASAPAAPAGATGVERSAACGPPGMRGPQPGQDAREGPRPAAASPPEGSAAEGSPPEGSAADDAAALDHLSLRDRQPAAAQAAPEAQQEAPRPTHVPMQVSCGGSTRIGAWPPAFPGTSDSMDTMLIAACSAIHLLCAV